MRIILRNTKNEIVVEAPAPQGWHPLPDIIRVQGKPFRFFGRQEGVASYTLAREADLPEGIAVTGSID